MFPYDIDPIDPEKDASDITKLIRTSFRPWLDLENLDYLDRLQEEGLYAQQHPFLTRISSFPYKLEGVVCRDQSGVLMGLINTYFFSLNGRRCCLIANVCVEPSHRKEGIASRMLAEVGRMQTADGIRDIFLQARLAEPETVEFYRRRGFRVTDYRETLVSPAKKAEKPALSRFRLERVPDSDTEAFCRQMRERYPASVLWNLDYKEGLFRTGLAAEVGNMLEAPVNRFRRVVGRDGKVLAWAAWQRLSGFADRLWEIPNGSFSEQLHAEVLLFLRDSYRGKKPLKTDIPAAAYTEAYRKAGFSHMQTLAWMWKRL
ncbi:MAG: GNAT family N-acetyltransferase [Flexilinea sp.]|nr:GNAT family N-acetyltransferase [Flexilinea sp.]